VRTKNVTLSPIQAAFCREYLVDNNGAQAAIRAGYSSKAAKEQATRLLTKAHIQDEIDRIGSRRIARADVSEERTIREVARIAFFDVRCMFREDGSLKDVHELTEDQAAAIQSVKVVRKNLTAGDGVQEWVHEIKLWDKPKALEMLMKKAGMFIERHRVEFDRPLEITLSLGDKVVNSNYVARDYAGGAEARQLPAPEALPEAG
jgi:phage terminase small subunit